MELATLGWLLAGLGVALVWVTIYTSVQFLITQAIASKASNSEYVMQQILRTSAYDLFRSIIASSVAAVSALIVSTLRLVQNLYRNRLGFAFSIIVFVFLLVIYFLQVPATETLVVGYQTVASPTLHKFVYPLLNVASMLGSIIVAGVNWIAQMMAFIFMGIPKIVIGCLLNQDIYSLFLSLMNAIFATTSDLVNWIVANPFISRYDTVATTTAIGSLLAQTTGVGNCTCAAVFFLYEDAVVLINSPVFVVTFDSAFNALLSISQRFTPLPLLFNEAAFTLIPFAQDAPIAINGAGNVLLLAVKLLANSIYGFFDTQNQLPQDIQDFLSQPLLEPGTQLVSGGVILLNVTLEAVKNPYRIYLGPTTGLPYFQFGKVIDRLRLAVRALGSYFILLGPNVVDAITKVLLVPVGLIGFVAEFVPQLFYFIFYPPIQNPLQFLVIYYQNPNNELLRTIADAYLAAEEVGLVVKLLNVPTGDVVSGVLAIIISLLQIIIEILFYSYNLFGFIDTTPTYTDISTTTFFASLILTNEAVGDFIRQFDPDFCFNANTTRYTDATVVCAFSNAITALIDTIISLLLNIVRFLQTFLAALRKPIVDLSSVDIPEFDVAITSAEKAGCSLATAILLLIPFELGCTFSDTKAAGLCHSGQTCAASTICNIWETLLAVLRIANDFFIKLREGGQFATYTDFFSSSIKQLIDDALQAFRSLALLLDCLICRVAHPGGTNCETVIFAVFDTLATAISGIVEFVTDIFFDILNLIVGLIKNLFVDKNFLKAIVDFTVGIVNLFLRLVGGILKLLINWLDGVGLQAISAVFKVFDFAFCNIVRGIQLFIAILTRSSTSNVPQCTQLSDFKRFVTYDNDDDGTVEKRTTFASEPESVDGESLSVDLAMKIFPRYEELPFNVTWKEGSECPDIIDRVVAQDNLTTSEANALVNNGLYCVALLYWNDYVETEAHGKISFENVCDYVMVDMHAKQPMWSSLSSVDQGITMQCIQQRYFMDFIRNQFNATFLPRDLRSNPLRVPIYAAGVLLDYLKVLHYYSDHNTLPGEVRQEAYIDSLDAKGINTTYITSNVHLSDREFGTYLDTLTLSDYLTMNDAVYHEEILRLDEFGRLIINGGIDTIIEIIESSKSEIDVSMGTVLLGDRETTSQSMVSLVYDIMYKSYKVVTVGGDAIAGTSEKRAILANGGVRIVEGFGYLASGVANLTAYTINSYGEYRDRLARINAGTATEEDRILHAENEVWWEQVKNKTFPWRWPIYNKPDRVRAHQQRTMRDNTCRGNATCDINTLVFSTNMHKNVQRRMHPRQKSIGEHVTLITESIDRLRTPTPEAQARYDAFASMFSESMDYFYQGYREGMRTSAGTNDLHFRTPAAPGVSLESVHASSTAGATIQSLFIGPPVCLSNFTTVCEKCLILDNGIATVLHASGNLIAYINGPFQSDMQARRDFLAYTYDDNAPVRVGQRPGLPVWFPLPTVNSFHYVGSPENITTIGFSDYRAITALFPSAEGIIRDNIAPGSFYFATFNAFDKFARPLISRIESVATWFSTGAADGTAGEISLVEKLIDDIFTCSYDVELDGSEQRFSVSLSFALTILIFFVTRAAIQLVFDADGFISNLLPSFMIAIYIFLYLGWNWSIMCFPALPLSLARQLFETIAYTFFPKCLYYISGMLEEGHYHDELYCSSIDLASDVRAYSCRLDGQFYDIFAHVAFITVNFWPSGVSFLQSVPYIRGYVDTFLAVDMTDPVLYSFSHTCNVTFGIVNFGLVIFGVFALSLLSEFLLSLVQVAAIPVLLIGDVYNTNFLAISETDYLVSIVADRERAEDRELVGEPSFATDTGNTSTEDGDDGFVLLNTPVSMSMDNKVVPLDASNDDDEEEEDVDTNERTPIFRTRVKISGGTTKTTTRRLFGLNRSHTTNSDALSRFDRL